MPMVRCHWRGLGAGMFELRAGRAYQLAHPSSIEHTSTSSRIHQQEAAAVEIPCMVHASHSLDVRLSPTVRRIGLRWPRGSGDDPSGCA